MAVNIIYLTPTTIQPLKVTIGRPPKIQAGQVLPIANLPHLKKFLGSTIRLLISDEFVYIASFSTNGNIALQAQEIIPENLAELTWSTQTTPSLVQVTAFSKNFSRNFLPLFTKAGFHITTIDSVAQALARLTPPTPTVVAYTSQPSLLFTTRNHLITTIETFSRPITPTDISSFMAKVGITTPPLTNLNPAIGLALKKLKSSTPLAPLLVFLVLALTGIALTLYFLFPTLIPR